MPQDEDDAAIPLEEGDLEPLSLADDEDGSGPISSRSSTKIHAFGSHATSMQAKQHEYKRTLNMTGAGAIRCKLFHAKLTVAAMEYMVNQINDWLDGSEFEVKSIGQVVGTLEGKMSEPSVIITVWY